MSTIKDQMGQLLGRGASDFNQPLTPKSISDNFSHFGAPAPSKGTRAWNNWVVAVVIGIIVILIVVIWIGVKKWDQLWKKINGNKNNKKSGNKNRSASTRNRALLARYRSTSSNDDDDEDHEDQDYGSDNDNKEGDDGDDDDDEDNDTHESTRRNRHNNRKVNYNRENRRKKPEYDEESIPMRTSTESPGETRHSVERGQVIYPSDQQTHPGQSGTIQFPRGPPPKQAPERFIPQQPYVIPPAPHGQQIMTQAPPPPAQRLYIQNPPHQYGPQPPPQYINTTNTVPNYGPQPPQQQIINAPPPHPKQTYNTTGNTDNRIIHPGGGVYQVEQPQQVQQQTIIRPTPVYQQQPPVVLPPIILNDSSVKDPNKPLFEDQPAIKRWEDDDGTKPLQQKNNNIAIIAPENINEKKESSNLNLINPQQE